MPPGCFHCSNNEQNKGKAYRINAQQTTHKSTKAYIRQFQVPHGTYSSGPAVIMSNTLESGVIAECVVCFVKYREASQCTSEWKNKVFPACWATTQKAYLKVQASFQVCSSNRYNQAAPRNVTGIITDSIFVSVALIPI